MLESSPVAGHARSPWIRKHGPNESEAMGPSGPGSATENVRTLRGFTLWVN
jgi:hypothetical protein